MVGKQGVGNVSPYAHYHAGNNDNEDYEVDTYHHRKIGVRLSFIVICKAAHIFLVFPVGFTPEVCCFLLDSISSEK